MIFSPAESKSESAVDIRGNAQSFGLARPIICYASPESSLIISSILSFKFALHYREVTDDHLVLLALLTGFIVHSVTTSTSEQRREVQPTALTEFYSRDAVQYYPADVNREFADQRTLLEAYKIESARRSAHSELK